MEYKNYTQKIIETNLNELYDKEIQIYGWIKRIRQGNNGEIIFIDILKKTKTTQKYQKSWNIIQL